MKKKTINFFVGPKRGVPQLRIPQLSSPLSSPPAHPSVHTLLVHEDSYENRTSGGHMDSSGSPSMDQNSSAQLTSQLSSSSPISSAPATTSYWRRQNPPIWMRMPQLSPSAQLQLPLSIGDDGIPQYGSESLRSAHLSVQLQLTHQLSSSFHFLLATTNLSVYLRIPQLSSPLRSAPVHTFLLEQQLYMSNIHVFLSQGGDIARSK